MRPPRSLPSMTLHPAHVTHRLGGEDPCPFVGEHLIETTGARSASTGVLLQGYLVHRWRISRARGCRLGWTGRWTWYRPDGISGAELVEHYRVLQAHKELAWFERSRPLGCLEEAERFSPVDG